MDHFFSPLPCAYGIERLKDVRAADDLPRGVRPHYGIIGSSWCVACSRSRCRNLQLCYFNFSGK